MSKQFYRVQSLLNMGLNYATGEICVSNNTYYTAKNFKQIPLKMSSENGYSYELNRVKDGIEIPIAKITETREYNQNQATSIVYFENKEELLSNDLIENQCIIGVIDRTESLKFYNATPELFCQKMGEKYIEAKNLEENVADNTLLYRTDEKPEGEWFCWDMSGEMLPYFKETVDFVLDNLKEKGIGKEEVLFANEIFLHENILNSKNKEENEEVLDLHHYGHC